MKNLLLLLSTLIFAVPAWAADTAGAPAAEKPAAQATASDSQPAKKATKKARKHKKRKTAESKSNATAAPLACATGCVLMNCPPPGGSSVCCHKVGGVYQPC